MNTVKLIVMSITVFFFISSRQITEFKEFTMHNYPEVWKRGHRKKEEIGLLNKGE